MSKAVRVFTAVATIGSLPASALADDAKRAVWPDTANVPANLGGTIDGRYTDRNGKTFDGTGYTVVDIDGAFRPDNPSFTTSAKSAVLNIGSALDGVVN